AVPGLGLRGARPVPAREAAGAAAAGLGGAAVLRRLRVRVLRGAAVGVRFPHRDHARGRGDDDRHQRLPELRAGDLPRLRHQLRAAGGAGDPGAAGLGDAGAAARMARLRDRRHVHPRRGDHAAGRGVAADARDPDVPAVRGRHPRRARDRAEAGRRGRSRRRAMTPATLSRRCAAWSLDAVPVAAKAVALCRQRLLDGLERFHAALASLSDAMARSMLEAMRDGTPMLVFARQSLADAGLRDAAAGLATAIVAALWPLLLAFAGVGLLYNVAFEVSPWQATPGKRALGLRVVDGEGRRIGVARAALRHVAGALSWLSLNLGHALAALRPHRRALHDVVSGTRV